MKNLSEYIHSLDLIRTKPLEAKIGNLPDHVVASSFGVGDEDFFIYLADARELGETGHGEPIKLELMLALEPGSYQMRAYSPVSGLYSPAVVNARKKRNSRRQNSPMTLY